MHLRRSPPTAFDVATRINGRPLGHQQAITVHILFLIFPTPRPETIFSRRNSPTVPDSGHKPKIHNNHFNIRVTNGMEGSLDSRSFGPSADRAGTRSLPSSFISTRPEAHFTRQFAVSRGRMANAANMTRRRADARLLSAASSVTPRRQALMDRVTALEATATKFASDNAGLKDNNDLLVARADDLGRRLHNKTRQANRARVSADTLRDALGRSKHARAIQAGRLERRKRDGI
ncbi:hypothetical protein B0H17DRAFT_1146421 [Mycena rosella]|uniref:Uncharacterized protein n=1 Tax=Mycena rosella TaxID=1033263 RepID=A0AAD7CP00_MYCRO|nr:hypothetical protein B0H17DRAFT_1146421 [Mycena rosella]